VKCLWVREETNEEIDLWPTIVVCSVADSLPNLECLEAVGAEYEPKWPLVRIRLRQGKNASLMPKFHKSLTSQALANQIRNLPISLETLYLCLEHSGTRNHEVQPPNLLVGGVDYFYKSIHHISIHLTTFAIRLSHISAALFWDLGVSPDSSGENLITFRSFLDTESRCPWFARRFERRHHRTSTLDALCICVVISCQYRMVELSRPFLPRRTAIKTYP
jgi:hypothetical protein